jgi:RecB family endonuclease NucS
MILLVGADKQLEKIVNESNFSEMGVWERTHMEEWIAEHPEILGEELFIITTEYDGFDKTNKRLDILAVDKKGKLVVIELKRDTAETFIDLQAIHYAAYCSTLTLEDVTEIAAEYHTTSKEEIELKINELGDTEIANV